MKKDKIFCILSLITVMIFTAASIALSASPMPVQRSVKPVAPAPAVQPQPTPQQAPQQVPQKAPQPIINYSMAIENFSLTSQCQVTFTVRNTGANLSVDQHKNSSIKIGQGAPMSLATFDPGGKLRTKGQTMIYLQNDPITKDTNMSVVVTLFNGKKITQSKLLKPTCEKPVLMTPTTPVAKPTVIPAQQQPVLPAVKPAAANGAPSGIPQEVKPKTPQMVIPTIPTSKPEVIPTQPTEGAEVIPTTQPGMNIPTQMTPKSGESPMGTKLMAVPKQMLSMPQTILQVEWAGGDLQRWENWAGTDTSMQKVDFRWKTELEGLQTARWEVSLTPDFPYVIASGLVTPIPPKGIYGYFSIDFSGISGIYAKPATFFIRVQPLKLAALKAFAVAAGEPTASTQTSQPAASSSADDPGLEPSTSVRVTIAEAGSGPVTEFHLPETHLKVVLTKVIVVDDSDDLSGGDLSFRLTVNGQENWKDFSDGALDTGDQASLGNLTVIVTDPPNFTGVSIFGCDNDDEPGEFTANAHCGNDPDTASVSFQINTGKNMGRWKIPTTNFNQYAQGGSLKFSVEGYYEMYCDPCP